MTSIAPSDSESNVSGFVRYSDKSFVHLYTSLAESLELIKENIMEVENNLRNIVIKQAGPLETQLCVLLQELPKPNITLNMEIE